MASECESELNIEEEMSNVSVHIPQNLNWIWSQKGRQLFHKVLQIVSNPENETGESSAAQTLLPVQYSIEGKTVQEHAGWVFKRVRDLINTGPQVHKIQVSKTNATEIEVDKNYLQSLIERFSKDNLVQPGKFLFIPESSVVEVFIYLHEILEKIVKDGLETCVDKDILKKCSQYLSEDKDLRKMWHKLLGDEDTDMFRAASVVLLQRVVVMFVKSKQQII